MQEPLNSSDPSPVRNRREAFKQVAGVAAGLGVSSLIGSKPFAAMEKASNRIVEENKKSGTTDWQLKKPEIDPATRYRSPWIEGYCSHASIRAGETLEVMVSANPVSAVTLDLYRLGYYGGAGARWIETLKCEEVKTESLPEAGEHRVMEYI
jgi:hypothetical protein